MVDFFNNITRDSVSIVKLGCIIILIILSIIFLTLLISSTQKKRFRFEQLNLNNEEERKRLSENRVRLLPWEAILFKTVHIDKPSFGIVWGIRIALCAIAIVAAAMFKFLAIYFVFEVIMYIYSINKAKKVEEDCGISYIPKTNAFLDMYIPAVNNGQTVNQIMDRFVNQEKDPDLIAWWNDENRDIIDPPLAWLDVVKIYRNGYYSEQRGDVDSAEVYQKDIVRQMYYYNNFKEKIADINPIKICYYIFMPIILCISYINDPDFWGDVFGFADTLILCVLLYAFTFFISDLHKETCRKLF